MKTSASNRWAQWALMVAFFLVGLILTFIVVISVWKNAATDLGQEYRQAVLEQPVERVRIPGGSAVEYQRLFEVMSEPGETIDSFALKIGPTLRAYSDASTYEACGALASDGNRFGVVIGSNRSHLGCVIFHHLIPEGMWSIGQSIHSHGGDVKFSANKNDLALQSLLFRDIATLRFVAGQCLDQFSLADFSAGAGYLATPTGVLHQNGSAKSVRAVHASKNQAGM